MIAGAWLFVFLALAMVFLGRLMLTSFARLVATRWFAALDLQNWSARRSWLALVLASLPVFFAIQAIFPWAQTPNPQATFRDFYLNPQAFIARAVLYFTLWGFVVQKQTRPGRGGAWMLVVLFFSASFASFDWIMSLEPDWHSTAFGAVFVASSVLLAFALQLLFSRSAKLSEQSNSLNNLHLALIGTWSYLVFMEFLTIWSGNLPTESAWYVHRFQGPWWTGVEAVACLQFIIPLPLLFFRRLKTSLKFTRGLALISVTCQLFHLYWMVAPARHADVFANPADLGAMIAILASGYALKRGWV